MLKKITLLLIAVLMISFTCECFAGDGTLHMAFNKSNIGTMVAAAVETNPFDEDLNSSAYSYKELKLYKYGEFDVKKDSIALNFKSSLKRVKLLSIINVVGDSKVIFSRVNDPRDEHPGEWPMPLNELSLGPGRYRVYDCPPLTPNDKTVMEVTIRTKLPATKENLQHEYDYLKKSHIDLQTKITSEVDYLNKATKLYQYNVVKLSFVFVVTYLKPPTGGSDLAQEAINQVLSNVGLSSETQSTEDKMEILNRIKKLCFEVDILIGQDREKTNNLRKRMQKIQDMQKKLH